MISFIFVFLLTLNFFSAENLAIMVVGTIASLGFTQWIKNQTGAMGLGAMVLALLVSIIVAIAAVVVSMFLSGDGFSWDRAAASALQVFALATIAYKTLMADKH